MEEHLTKRLEGLTVLIGLDENTSNLFNFFCNALYLGQWELARACVHILRKTNQKPVDFVQDIARQPFNRCVYSPSVPSACHLAWLSHLETQDTTTRDTHQDLAEFHFLLLEVCPYIADIHLKELYSYFKWLHTPMTSLTPGHMLTLSPGLLKFLQTLLTTHTRLAHNLITHITHTPSHGDLEPLTKNHRAIQFVYMNAVNGLLDSLTQSDLDEDLKHSHVGKIYDILALFDLPRDISPQLVKPVLSKLIEVANLWPGLLKNQAVMSVLVGQGDTCMLEEFCRLDYEAETNKAVETYQICAELSEEQRWLLHLLSLTDANCRWKMMLMFAVKTKRHVLEVIMETGLALIKCSMFNKLSALLEPPELHPLKPLLLLLGWTSCINSSEGRELLHTLWNKKSDSEHPAITMGCKKLAYQIDLIQWCVEKARPLMKEDVSGPRLSRSVDLFRGLESHSVLYVLNTSTRLSALDQGEVLQLLQKVPLTLQPEDKDKKRVKSVRFQEFEDPSPVSSTPDSDSPSLSLDQLKDMSIYTGFCALKNVMDAIWYCAQSPDVRLSRPVLLQGRHALSRRLMSGSSSESDRSRSNSEVSLPDDTNLGSNDVVINESPGVELNIHTLYAENVTSKLNAAKNYLAKLQPLTFRVEMLENVFSLLFVTHDDIQDILQASEYNSDEGDDSKSASGDVQTPVLTPIKELPSRGKTGVAKLQDNTNVTAAYDEPYVETPTGSHVDQPSIEADEKIDMNKVGKALENIKAHISKKRHKSSDDNWLDRRSSVSENISSLSASSSVNMDLIGFICSEYLVRDILAMLKDCILDVSAAKFHIHGNKTDSRDRYKPVREAVTKATVDLDPNIEEPLCHLVKSSVTMETLQKRITQLEKFTSEAHWRYQLVSDEHIPLAPGEVLSEVVMTTGGMSDDEVEIKDKKGSRRRRSSSSKNGKDAQELHAGRRPSQGRHSVSRVSVAKIPGGQSRSRSRQLVSTMLASPASLLTMSIRRGQTTQTRQIIKLFKLDATPEAVEVYFSQAMEKAVHAVQRSPGKDTQGQGVKVGLRGVAAAAAAGLANVTISDIADELLKSPHLPEIPVPLNVVSLPINIAQVLCKDNGPLIILLDLMLIATNSWEVCSHLMASITSKLAGHTVPVDSSTAAQDSRNASTKQRVSKIRTFPDIVSQLQKLLNLGIEEEIPSREHILLSRTFQRSLQHYLSHATLSLSAEKNKEYVILCQNLAMCISRTNDAFALSKSKSPGSPESTAQSMVVDERERSRSRLSSGSRSRLGSAADRPVIHHCFKQLIHLMEKDVPASGLLAFVNKSLSSNQTARRNYLLNVYEHCKELAFLVEEAEIKDKDGVVAPKNYFHVLEEGPLRILGRMMFTKKMAPAKLEKVASKLSLNLTHIIVYSCCERVPSKRLPALTATPGQEVERVQGQGVHNMGQYTGNSSYVGPEECVRQILTKLIAVMRDVSHGCNASGIFDRTCAQQIWKRADFHEVITQARLLQSADLSDLDPAHRKCFYGNLLSLMTVHCFLHHQQTVDSQNAEDSEAGEVGVPYTNLSPIDQLMVLSDFSYRVGQLGVVSVFDLRYQICRTGLPAPSEWGPVLKHRLYDLDPCDPWVTFAPTPDPLLLFGTTSCCVSSPPLQVLEPSKVEEQLRSNIAGYLEATVNIHLDQNQVRVPELLLWYRRDFLATTDHSEGGDSMGDLLTFVSFLLGGDKGTQLLTLLKTDKQKQQLDKDGKSKVTIDIEVLPFCKEYLVSFDFKSLNENKPLENDSSKPNTQPLDRHSSDVATTYNLTPNTMEYIKSDCPLIATLVSLMCQDNFDEALIDNVFGDHFENSGSPGSPVQSKYQLNLERSRAASSMSTLDIRSYRYEKLENDYPALKRRLLNYIVPLAATEDPEILKGGDPILKLLTSDVLERFKTNMLSLHESQNFRGLLSDLLNELLSVRKWPQMLKIIDSIPVNIVHKHASMSNLHDFIVCCAVHKVASESPREALFSAENSSMVVCLLSRMISPERRVRQVLAVHRQLRIEHCLDMFEVCVHSQCVSVGLMDSLHTRYSQLKVYHRITECAKNLQIKLSMQGADFLSADDRLANQKRHNILQQFTDWSNVVTWTRNTPREVLGLLTKAGDFKTAKTWAQLENLPEDIKTDIEVNHIIALLNLSPPNTAQAFMILEGLRSCSVEVCLETSRKFLDTFSNQQHIMFVASYMLKQLASSLSGAEQTRVRLVHIGARMVQCLPVQMHSEYSHLVSKPRFILEQLLMNMRPELAGKAFSVVQEEFTLVPDPAFKFSPEQFNMLVSLYAKKALEFTVVQCIEEPVKERSLSVRSVSSQDLERLSPLPRSSIAPTRPDPSMKRRSIDLQGSIRLGLASKRTDSPSSRSAVLGSREPFVMPSEPPARDQWVPDSAVSVCMVCHVERFSMFSRRHHCRRCGRVVCGACSANVSIIKGISARTCDDCYGEINKSSEILGDRRLSAAEIYSRQRLSDASPGGSPVTTAFSHAYMASMAISEQATTNSLADIVNHSHSAWKLQTDEEYNANMREDFYFEQAPSTSLCISILNLHSNGRECGRLILGLCDTLSCLLKPLAPGVPNPEVDYNLIMSMMKYLLFHAKMKFTRHGDNAGMGRCDVYQGLVDLLGLLVVDNYPDLPSIEELTKVESVRRLRDKLIADERLSLAMEVSTKCGLDPAGVWVAWGMMALQSGDFTTARDKFSRCLKPVKDRNVCTPIPSVVKDIVECLESMPGTGSMEIQVLLANPGSIKSLISTPSSTFFEETSMDSAQFQECVFYLRTYGTYLSLVDFHRRHGYFMKAVQYILDHKCSVEVYIEGLLRPSIECGELGRLKDQMLLIDPSLERWNPFLTATCRHLVKNKLHHLLHDFQIFMKDFIRAGITCFTYFYQEGAQSYLDLARRITFLFTAQQHMQAYLEPAHWGNVQHPLSVRQRQEGDRDDSTAVRLVKGPEEVSRYMKTIALQIEVTKYLQTSFSGPTGEALATRAAGLSKLPTLFAGQPVRNDLTIMILLCGENLETSFTLALRIIKEYKLGAVGIFTHVAREMAKLRSYDNLRGLLGCVEKTEYSSDDVMDEILGACLIVVADIPEEAKEAENIIKMLRKDANKINAYILCGKLKSAYLLAVKDGRTEEVRRILRAAKSMNQPAVVNICNKWLEQNSA